MLHNWDKIYTKNSIRFAFFSMLLTANSCGNILNPSVVFTPIDDLYDTLLFQAVRKGDMQAFIRLIENGADLYVLHGKGKYTVLHLAIEQYHSNETDPALKQRYGTFIIDLINRGGPKLLNIQDTNGRTSLHYAVLYIKDYAFLARIMPLLLSYKDIHVNQSDEDGNTVLHLAIEQLNEDPLGLEVVCLLLQNNDIDIHLQNKAGIDPLALARTKQKLKMVGLLEEYTELMKDPMRKANLAMGLRLAMKNLPIARDYYYREGSFEVVDKDDKILVGMQAKIMLDRFLKDKRNNFKHPLMYWDLKSNGYKQSTDGLPAFEYFYTTYYQKGKHFREDLLKVKQVGNEDPREGLRGQDKVVAVKDIPAWTLLGIYTGILLAENKTNNSKDLEAESQWLQEQSAGGLNNLENYAFHIKLSEDEGLCLSGFGRGNILMKINANTTYSTYSTYPTYEVDVSEEPDILLYESDVQEEPNVEPLLMRYKNNIPFVAFWSTEDIKKDQELLIDYGPSYWKDHKVNYTDLSRPHAPIYQEYLKNHLEGSCYAFKSFFRRKHPIAYRKIKTEGPASPEKTIPLNPEDKIVHVVRIDGSI